MHPSPSLLNFNSNGGFLKRSNLKLGCPYLFPSKAYLIRAMDFPCATMKTILILKRIIVFICCCFILLSSVNFVSYLSLVTSGTGEEASLQSQFSKVRTMVWDAYRGKPISYWILLALSSGGMLVAFPASSLLSRLYYTNGGKSKWIISWVAVAGWPLTALFLIPTYFFCKVSPTPFSFKLTLSYIVLGFLSAADNLMYAWAYAYLPASTASLLASSSLVFSALFGYFLVKNKLNSSMINAIVFITAATAIIALDSGSDRYGYVSKSQYTLGFIWDILGSALHGLIFALSELVFMKLLGRRSFHVVLEQQVMVSLCAFAFTTIGVVASNDFNGMKSEARSFKHGETSYYMVLIWSAVTFQLGVLGGTAVLYLASTMLAGVLNAVRVPITSIAAVILLNDPMSGFKILSLIITVWGLGSYIFGSSYLRRHPPNVQQSLTAPVDSASFV